MKKRIVIKVTMSDPKKSRTKALKIAATARGVESVALTGDEMDQIEVIGEQIDTIELTRLLRKKVGCADLVSVGPIDMDQMTTAANGGATVIPMVWSTPPLSYPAYYGVAPTYPVYETREPSCSIV